MKEVQKKILIAIIIMIILVIICIIALLVYLMNAQEQMATNEQITETNEYDNTFYAIDEIEANTEILLVDSQSQYYSIIACLENYYNNILEGNNQKLYDILAVKYIEDNEITQENVIGKSNVENLVNANYNINEMYKQETDNIYKYYINGYLRDTNINTYFIVFVDMNNATYSIYPIDKEYYNNIVMGKESIDSEQIQENENNLYTVVTVKDETTAQRLLEDYQYLLENNIQLSYEKLDSEYRQAKFSNLQEYSQYINNIGIKQTKIAQYQKTKKDGYTQYVILDEKGKYYVFKETSVMNYTVLLDIYTVELPELVEGYNSKNESEKVQYNLQLWFYSINDGDYKYAYNKLDQTYRNNNFPTQADFENYMKTTFYSQNKLGYTSYEKNGDLYIYKMVITNADNETQTIEKQFVVKLLEGTDFVMSFEK